LSEIKAEIRKTLQEFSARLGNFESFDIFKHEILGRIVESS
jgi:hypothetical protein